MKPSEFPRDAMFHTAGPALIDNGIAHLRSYVDVNRALRDVDELEFSQDKSYWVPDGTDYHITFDFVWTSGKRKKDGSLGRHTVLSNVLKSSFSPRFIRTLSGHIEREARTLLCSIVDKGVGKTELASEFAYPLARHTIMTMLGLPIDTGEWLAQYVRDYVSLPVSEQLPPEPQAVRDYFCDAIDTRQRGAPQGDMLDVLIEAWKDHLITEREVLGSLLSIAEAGNDSTAAAIVNFIALLAEFRLLPEARGQSNNDAWLKRAGEETLRFSPTFPAGLSHTVTEVRLADGVIVPPDTPARLWFSAANRDPAVFQDPNTFDVTRWPNPHLGFGHGLHYCLGAGLARLEMRIALREALQALPHLELDPNEPFERTPGMVDNVKASFEFDQRAAEAAAA